MRTKIFHQKILFLKMTNFIEKKREHNDHFNSDHFKSLYQKSSLNSKTNFLTK